MHYERQRIADLERTVRRLTFGVTACVLTLAALLLSGFKPAEPAVLRAKGLIIEDAQGRPRVLIGAPAPFVPERVRTSHALAVKAWGSRFPQMEWYKKLNHDVQGIILLDEKGFDRVTLGAPNADPNIGRRIDAGVGMNFNDQQGFERGGLTYFDRAKRGVMGLDNDAGEGLVAFVEKDVSGMVVHDRKAKSHLFAGAADPSTYADQGRQDRLGVWIVKEDGSGVVFGPGGKSPAENLRPQGPQAKSN